MSALEYAIPTEQDSVAAREATAKIIPYVRDGKPLKVLCVEGASEETILLPAFAAPLIQKVLEAIAAGHGVTIIPQHAELTTMEAADILNVSRPFVIKLLESGDIPYRKVGRHRRILLEDLMSYKEKSDEQSRAAMDELVALSEELGLYDL